jgi:hypothetical protein
MWECALGPEYCSPLQQKLVTPIRNKFQILTVYFLEIRLQIIPDFRLSGNLLLWIPTKIMKAYLVSSTHFVPTLSRILLVEKLV